MERRYEGGCLCGAVRYVAMGEPVNELICHCRLCQKAIGASFNARLLFRHGDVVLSGPVGNFNSSDDLQRGFCPACGTTIFAARASTGMVGVTAGSLDDPALFHPSAHVWVDSRQPWLDHEDTLPCYPEQPPR